MWQTQRLGRPGAPAITCRSTGSPKSRLPMSFSLAAASPMTSVNQSNECQLQNPFFPQAGESFPSTVATASRALRSMCCNRTMSSCCVILHHCFRKHPITVVLAQETLRIQVHLSSKNFTQYKFQTRQSDQAHSSAWLEFHKYVYIALRGEVIAQGRAEEG